MNCGALSYMLEHSDAVILESYGLGGLPAVQTTRFARNSLIGKDAIKRS